MQAYASPRSDKTAWPAAAICIASVPLIMVVNGWALSTMWGWFLVPLGMPPIGMANALGVAVIVGMFTHNLARQKSKSASHIEEMCVVIGRGLLSPLISLFLGWIIRGFM